MIPESVLLGWKISITFLHALAILSTLLRLLRRHKQAKLWWDDAAAFIALLGLVVATPVMWLVFVNIEMYYTKKAILYWFLTIPFFITIWSTRLSLSLSLHRLFPTHRTPKILSISFVFVLITLLIWECTTKCDREAPFLDEMTFLHCLLEKRGLMVGLIGADITADILLLLTSLSLLLHIHLPPRQRTLLRVLFSASVLTLLSAVVVCVCVFVPVKVYRGYRGYKALVAGMSAELEMSIAVIVCNLQVLAPWVFGKFLLSSFPSSPSSPSSSPSSRSMPRSPPCDIPHIHHPSCFLPHAEREAGETGSGTGWACARSGTEWGGMTSEAGREGRTRRAGERGTETWSATSLAFTEVWSNWSDSSTFRSCGRESGVGGSEEEVEEVMDKRGDGEVGPEGDENKYTGADKDKEMEKEMEKGEGGARR